jgi:hypothetical protein
VPRFAKPLTALEVKRLETPRAPRCGHGSGSLSARIAPTLVGEGLDP